MANSPEKYRIPLEIRGVDKAERECTAMEYLEKFGLKGFENKDPRELSGGMRQRVAIARTQDRPDGRTFWIFGQPDKKLWLERKGIIMFVIHNVDQAVFLSDRIIALSKRPSHIARIFAVPLPRHRDRTGRQCNRIRKGVLRFLAKEPG